MCVPFEQLDWTCVAWAWCHWKWHFPEHAAATWLLAEEHSHTGGIKGIYQAGFFCKAQQPGVNQQSLSACCSAKCKRERESSGLSHSRMPRFPWAPGNLQLPVTTCRASLTCEKDTSVIPPLWPSLSCSAYKRGSQTSTLPVLFPGKVFHSERCLGAGITGFTLEAVSHAQMEGWKGKLSLLPTAWCVRLNTALPLTSTLWSSAISPPTQSLTYHVYSLGLRAGLRVEQATINMVGDSLP